MENERAKLLALAKAVYDVLINEPSEDELDEVSVTALYDSVHALKTALKDTGCYDYD